MCILCTNCEKAVRKLKGVENAAVNLATEKLTIAYNPSEIAPDDISSAVANSGYAAILETSEEKKTSQEERRAKETKI